ncbi:MAG: lysylphosphatidylglycerol synthase transmembrane domain-containing protein [Candidatus Izemoplasmatales bacterium]|jgi:uncharacterized protein (TIRG00374 family)|nr:lysylphosphatidylglycerol synthase transmembrane domain-containing protein [bacterium]MDZ4196220.1 lysylphosphatidylglycerol synthase transmembrane domain-containing protein [Candidatus Izemoplasmatales bacterium]
MKQKSRRRVILSYIFLAINIIIVVIIGLIEFRGHADIRFREMVSTWMQHWPFLMMALFSTVIALLAEGLKYFFLIKKSTGQFRLFLAIKTAIVGKYYDNITPLGSGGQAFQIYTLYKGGIPSGIAGSLPISGFSMMQIAFFVLGLGSFLFNGHVVTDSVFRAFAFIGLGFMIFLPVSVIFFIVVPKLSTAIVSFFAKILHRLHLIKSPEKVVGHILKSVADFKVSMQELFTSKLTLFVTFALSILYQLALCTIPYFVIRAAGYQVDWFDTVTLTLFVYSAIAFVPTPGNAGAAEFSFTIIFTVIASGMMFWSMMLWRFASYYLFIIIGLIAMIIGNIRGKQETFPRPRNIADEEL